MQAQIAALPKPKRPVIDADVAATEAARAVALAGVLGGRVSWDRHASRRRRWYSRANVSLTALQAQLPPPVPAGTAAAAAPLVRRLRPRRLLPTGVTIEGYTKDQPSVARLLARLAHGAEPHQRPARVEHARADRQEVDRPVHRPRRHQAARRCPVNAFLHTKKGMLVAGAAGLVLVLAAGWFFVVAPERKQADELAAKVAASEAELAQKRAELARPSAAVRVKADDLFRLSKALPDRGRLGGRDARPRPDRQAEQADVLVDHAGAGRSDRRRAATAVRRGARGSVHERVEVPAADPQARGRAGRQARSAGAPVHGRPGQRSNSRRAAPTFPVVRATVRVNAFSFTPTAAAPGTDTTQTTTTSTGTVAAGATP